MRKELLVRWNESAVTELQDIYNAIEKHSPQNAMHVVTTLFDLGESLGLFPEKYPKDRFIKVKTRNIRSVPKWSFKIIYEVLDDAVDILSVVITSNDPTKLYNYK